MHRRLRRILLIPLIAAVISACTLGGMSIALLAASSDTHRTSFGTIESSARPDLNGRVTVYVPLVDWRVRLLAHRAPVDIRLELRGIDRERAGKGISSSEAAEQSIGELRRDSARIVESAVRRAAIVAAIGGLIGGVLAGALLTSTALRRRWLLAAPALAALVVAGVLIPSLSALADMRSSTVTAESVGRNADELPRVLRFAGQLLSVGDEYEDHYGTALRGLSNLAAFAQTTGPAPDQSVLLVSDVHDNAFVLDSLDAFAGGDTVFAAGDFVQVGASIEERTAPPIARLGGRVIAVSGNHDTPEFMAALAESGATVLDRDDVTTRDGTLLVAGYPDPLERAPNSDGTHVLRVYGNTYREQQRDFLAWWDDLDTRPDVVMVHQHGFAHRLLEHLREQGDDAPLLVLTGHDHKPHVHVDGRQVLVDGGTLGAGGLAAVGEQPASFARIALRDGAVTWVDVISIEPIEGDVRTKRTQVTG
ncbi:MAG: metallophosphoesterase [Thermoleophilia bacterium]|nr:metallophosphoesterase [Thermoleophilia bacterium]